MQRSPTAAVAAGLTKLLGGVSIRWEVTWAFPPAPQALARLGLYAPRLPVMYRPQLEKEEVWPAS
jgi:hypothetical protein